MTAARCQHGVGGRHRADKAGGIQPLANAESANDEDDGSNDRVRGPRKSFGPTLALDDMTFTVTPGQVTGFIGPNGPRSGRPFPAGLSPAGMACRGEVLPRS